jgi:hypothetical protein
MLKNLRKFRSFIMFLALFGITMVVNQETMSGFVFTSAGSADDFMVITTYKNIKVHWLKTNKDGVKTGYGDWRWFKGLLYYWMDLAEVNKLEDIPSIQFFGPNPGQFMN